MKIPAGKRRIFLLSLLGAVSGYLFLHPYTMLVFALHERLTTGNGRLGLLERSPGFADLFDPNMLPMGIPFALLGAVAGLFFGFWLEARLHRFEMEKRLCAVETLRQLMVTLAHHLLNSVQGIGGFAAYVIRKEQDEDIKHRLEIIRNEARKIEAVIKSLQSLEVVATERYIKNSETIMIDIRKELQERLKEIYPEEERREG